LEDSERADDAPRILDPALNAQHVLDVRRFEGLQATVFDEWDAPPCELYRKLVAMVPRTEQHRLPLQIDARLGLFPLALLLSSMRIAAGRDRGFELVSLTETAGEQARIASSVCRRGFKHRSVASTN
jgi:hypothetical protein